MKNAELTFNNTMLYKDVLLKNDFKSLGNYCNERDVKCYGSNNKKDSFSICFISEGNSVCPFTPMRFSYFDGLVMDAICTIYQNDKGIFTLRSLMQTMYCTNKLQTTPSRQKSICISLDKWLNHAIHIETDDKQVLEDVFLWCKSLPDNTDTENDSQDNNEESEKRNRIRIFDGEPMDKRFQIYKSPVLYDYAKQMNNQLITVKDWQMGIVNGKNLIEKNDDSQKAGMISDNVEDQNPTHRKKAPSITERSLKIRKLLVMLIERHDAATKVKNHDNIRKKILLDKILETIEGKEEYENYSASRKRELRRNTSRFIKKLLQYYYAIGYISGFEGFLNNTDVADEIIIKVPKTHYGKSKAALYSEIGENAKNLAAASGGSRQFISIEKALNQADELFESVFSALKKEDVQPLRDKTKMLLNDTRQLVKKAYGMKTDEENST